MRQSTLLALLCASLCSWAAAACQGYPLDGPHVTAQLPGDWILRSDPAWPTVDYTVGHPLTYDQRNAAAALAAAFRARGMTVVGVPLPPRAIIAYQTAHLPALLADYNSAVALANYRNFVAQMNHLGLKTLDLTQIVDSKGFYFKHDVHWHPEGAEAASQLIAQEFIKLNIKPDTKYNFHFGYVGHSEGNLGKLLDKDCSGKFIPESYNVYGAEQIGDSRSLLSDDKTYPVFGTSNTANTDFGFLAFLKKNTGTSIYSAAVTGGFTFGALEDWFQNPANKAPAVSVWEYEYIDMVDSPDNSFLTNPSPWNESLSAGAWKVAARLAGQPAGTVAAISRQQGRTVIRTRPLGYGEGVRVELPRLGQQVVTVTAYAGQQSRVIEVSKNDQVQHNDGIYYFVNHWKYFPVDRIDVSINNQDAPVINASIIKLPVRQPVQMGTNLPINLLDMQSNSTVSKDGFAVLQKGHSLNTVRNTAFVSFSHATGRAFALRFTVVSPVGQALQVLLDGAPLRTVALQAGVPQTLSLSAVSAGSNELAFVLPGVPAAAPAPLLTFLALSITPDAR